MSFAFAVAKDAVRTTVQSYVPGSGSLTVASGTGQLFPVPTPTAPILFTVITTATYATYPENYATYQATGISGDTLTGLTLISGIDNAWGVGAIVEMRTCAKHLNDLAAQSGTGGGGGGGTGTVTGVSVATANGFAGTVATPSTTPAITIKTTVNGMTKGNGTALVPATPTDYQVPIQFSTSGTSGPATFNSSTGALNIPVYPGGSGGGGSGTVGSGTAGQLAGYVASGTAVSGVNTGVTINQHTVAPVVLAGTSGTQTLDLSTGDLFTLSGAMTGNITLALANPPTSGLTQTFRFLAKQAATGGPFSLAYPSGVVWVGSSTAPDMTKVAAGQTMELVFTYVSSSLILGHYPGTTNTDPAGGGGSGVVGAGTAGQFAGYGAAGTSVAGMTTGLTLTQHTTAAVVPTATSGSVPIDLSASDLFGPVAMTGNCTLVFNNPPVAGLTQTFRVLMKQAASGGPFSLAYPSAVVWVGSSSGPDMTAVPAGQTLELVFTYLSSGLILGHFPGVTNTDPAGGGGGGGSIVTETSETANFNAVAGGFYAISGSANVTATLPTAAGIAGQTVRIRCVAGYTGLCTITGTSGQTIAGATSRVIYAGESPLLQSDGANWVRTGGTVIPCSCRMTMSVNQSIGTDGQHVLLLDTVVAGSTPHMGNTGSNGINLIRAGNYNVTTGVSIANVSTTDFVMFTLAYSTGTSPIGNGLRTAAPSLNTTFGIAGSAVQLITGGLAGDLITIKAYQTNTGNNAQTFDNGNYLIVDEILSW